MYGMVDECAQTRYVLPGVKRRYSPLEGLPLENQEKRAAGLVLILLLQGTIIIRPNIVVDSKNREMDRIFLCVP